MFSSRGPSFIPAESFAIHRALSLSGLSPTFDLAGHKLAATGIWDGQDATSATWFSKVGPDLVKSTPFGLGTNLNPTLGVKTGFSRYPKAPQFNDGYGYGSFSDLTFANPGSNKDIICEVVFKANSNSALMGKYDNTGNGGWLIWENSAKKLRFSNENNGYSPPDVLTEGTWYHGLAVSIRSVLVDGLIVLDGYSTAAIDGTHPGNADSTAPFCVGQEDHTIFGNICGATIAHAMFWIGTLGFTPTSQQIIDMASTRYTRLLDKFSLDSTKPSGGSR